MNGTRTIKIHHPYIPILCRSRELNVGTSFSSISCCYNTSSRSEVHRHTASHPSFPSSLTCTFPNRYPFEVSSIRLDLVSNDPFILSSNLYTWSYSSVETFRTSNTRYVTSPSTLKNHLLFLLMRLNKSCY